MPRRSTLRLTKRSVDALSSERKDTVFWDRDLAGFGVRVLPSGRKVFVVQSRGPGGSKRVSLGRYGSLTADKAREKAAAVIDRIKRGEAPKPETAGPVTVADLAERFLTAHVAVHCKPNTQASYRGVLMNHVVPALGDRAVESIERSDVIRLHRGLHATPQQANLVVQVFSRMMSLAESWELCPAGGNPCRGVRLYRKTSRERFLTPDEVKRLGRVLTETEKDGSVWPGIVAAVRLLILTGCRRSEILSLRWDDVDRTAGLIRLRDSKTGPRAIPLTSAVKNVLEGIEKTPGSDNVIVGQRFGKPLVKFHSHWNVIRERAGLEDVRLHDLRHSYASRALALGESLPTIGKLLGHRKVATTAKYAHLVRDAEKAAAARVGASIGDHLGREGPANGIPVIRSEEQREARI